MKRRQDDDDDDEEEVKAPPTISQVLVRVLGQMQMGRAADPGAATEEELIAINDVEAFKQLMERKIALTEEDVTVAKVKRFPPWLTELIRRIKNIGPTDRVDFNSLRQAVNLP